MRAPAQLDWAFLSEVQLRTDPVFDWSEASGWDYEVVPEVEIEDPFEREDGGLAATVRVNVTIGWFDVEERTDETTEGREEREPPFDLRLQTTGYFSWTPRMRPDEDRTARLWLEYNGQYLLWPYIRTYVAVLTGMTNVLPLTIETLRVPDPPEIDAHADSDTPNAESTTHVD